MKPRKALAPQAQLTHQQLCDAVAELHAKVQYLLTAQTFIEGASLDEFAELRRQLISEPPREWLTVREAAELCGRTPQCVRSWCRSERLGVFDKGVWKITRHQLRQFVIDRLGEDRIPAALREG